MESTGQPAHDGSGDRAGEEVEENNQLHGEDSEPLVSSGDSGPIDSTASPGNGKVTAVQMAGGDAGDMEQPGVEKKPGSGDSELKQGDVTTAGDVSLVDNALPDGDDEEARLLLPTSPQPQTEDAPKRKENAPTLDITKTAHSSATEARSVEDDGTSPDDIAVDFGPGPDRRPGFRKYTQGMKNAIPIRTAKRPKDRIPLETNGLISYSTFGWLNPLLWGVYKRGVSHVRGLAITQAERAEVNAQRMDRFWQEERAKKGDDQASFGKAIVRAFRTRLLIGAFVSLIYALLTLALPIIVVQYFLKYLAESENVSIKSGIVYVILLGLVVALKGVTSSFSWMLNFEAATRIKYGCLALLYRKVLHVKSLQGKTEGDMANFISNDGQRIWDGIIMGPFIIGGPMILIISWIYCVVYLGPWALVSIFIVIGFFPFMVTLAKMSEKYKEVGIKLTDRRVAIITQILSSIKLIKLYVWENAFLRKVSDLRAAEAAVLSRIVFVTSINMGVAMLVPVLAACVTFVAYVASGNNLTPTEAFTFLALLHTMASAMMTIPFALKSLAELAVTTRRIQEVLLMDEIKPYPALGKDIKNVVVMANASFSWGRPATNTTEAGDKTKKEKKKKGCKKDEEEEHLQGPGDQSVIFVGSILQDVNFSLKQGHLVGICGSVGSGKSSLIQAILGRMEHLSGEVAVMPGQVAYAPQQAWVINSSLRENILFGSSYNSDRYKSVVEACAMVEDFKAFPSGDCTEVGERGATLSGGQRQRVCLARAAYSGAPLILLDDPLSAVDVQVAEHIFSSCIQGEMRRAGSTVVLVSHQLKYLKECDEIIVMKDGTVAEQGSHQQLLEQRGEYAALVHHFSETESQGVKEGIEDTNTADESKTVEEANQTENKPDGISRSNSQITENGTDVASHKQAGQLMTEEELDESSLQWTVVKQYANHMGGVCASIMLVASFCLPVAAVTLASWFLSYWLEQGGGTAEMFRSNGTSNWTVPSMRVLDNPHRKSYMLIYLLIVIGSIILTVLKSLAITKWTLTANTSLHKHGILSIIASPMSFFDSTPVGRMINRFSADLDEIDSRLPMNLDVFLTTVLQIIGALVMIAYVSPWFLLACIPLAALFAFIWIVFHDSARQLKMLDNVTRSPAISDMGAAVQGAASVNAYRGTPGFVQRHCELLNANAVAVLLFYAANRWLALYLDFVSAGVAFVTGLLVLLTFDLMSPALAGLALTYCIQMSGLFQFATRLAVETEARMTSAQRILEYCNIEEKEGESFYPLVINKVPAGWPSSGVIAFRNVDLRYRDGLPLALKNVTFETTINQRIGVVGRTGAGKSSLLTALVRLVEVWTGVITVDDVDISTISLSDLRKAISIIPQEPVLFSATMRYNIDPYKEYSDDDIWLALEKCHVKELVQSLEGQLEFEVSENGANFSVGEKQLICMARALLRNSKVVVLDEATASIDLETDELIQQTLNSSFQNCTLLVIAHRLSSVLSCDKILLLENGEVAEFDTPSNLQSQPGSKFKAMMAASS